MHSKCGVGDCSGNLGQRQRINRRGTENQEEIIVDCANTSDTLFEIKTMEQLVVHRPVEGKRSSGRPHTRWTDLIKALTRASIVLSFRDAEERSK